jgi:hypothetical protein
MTLQLRTEDMADRFKLSIKTIKRVVKPLSHFDLLTFWNML